MSHWRWCGRRGLKSGDYLHFLGKIIYISNDLGFLIYQMEMFPKESYAETWLEGRTCSKSFRRRHIVNNKCWHLSFHKKADGPAYRLLLGANKKTRFPVAVQSITRQGGKGLEEHLTLSSRGQLDKPRLREKQQVALGLPPRWISHSQEEPFHIPKGFPSTLRSKNDFSSSNPWQLFR